MWGSQLGLSKAAKVRKRRQNLRYDLLEGLNTKNQLSPTAKATKLQSTDTP